MHPKWLPQTDGPIKDTKPNSRCLLDSGFQTEKLVKDPYVQVKFVFVGCLIVLPH